jgi:hypothetical protein
MDMDNDKVAALLDKYLQTNGLDGYANAKAKGHWVWDK